ncbi:MAG TPA: Sir2 family NAD-dependent protein deacetylase [Eoetvoesiella sp.]
MTTQYEFIKAAQLISHADGLIIAAGAGMGVDSGLPDFRGNAGFWQHYPALQKSGIDFQDMASPSHFWSSPCLAWGFYGHRLAMYRQTQPHAGFQILKRIASRLPHDAFVYTSNVDGQFQKAGFAEDQIHECHGSLHYLQCIDACRRQIWSAQEFMPVVDNDMCQLVNDPPACPACGLVARPNVLMFNDMGWVSRRSDGQRDKLYTWLQKVSSPVVIELGAGTAIATVRSFAERQRGPLIRINMRDAHLRGSSQHVSLQMGALQALEGIYEALLDQAFF